MAPGKKVRAVARSGGAGNGARVKAAHRRTGIWGSRYLVILRSAAGIAAASLHKLVTERRSRRVGDAPRLSPNLRYCGNPMWRSNPECAGLLLISAEHAAQLGAAASRGERR